MISNENDKKTEEKQEIFKKFLTYSLKTSIESILRNKYPQKTSDIVQCFLDNNNKITSSVWKDGTIGFYIGKQRTLRYAVVWYNDDLYFQMKFDDFTEYFEQYLKKVDKNLLTRWRIDGRNTFIMSIILKPETLYETIYDFIDLTLDMMKLYL